MKISMGCDHGAYLLKNRIAEYLRGQGHDVKDYGTFGPEPVNYPIYAEKVCRDVTSDAADFGILLCTTGIGMSIAANKFSGVRAALCGTEYQAHMTRLHNNANVLVLGAGVVGEGLARNIVDEFLRTGFMGAHHVIRVGMIENIEKTGHV
ncbi:MAG: ribose 5-phosphate isomerase B [Clostridia bacterium]|nr:ribose 5-phosphate isomerase B [Clostridia bacterium]